MQEGGLDSAFGRGASRDEVGYRPMTATTSTIDVVNESSSKNKSNLLPSERLLKYSNALRVVQSASVEVSSSGVMPGKSRLHGTNHTSSHHSAAKNLRGKARLPGAQYSCMKARITPAPLHQQHGFDSQDPTDGDSVQEPNEFDGVGHRISANVLSPETADKDTGQIESASAANGTVFTSAATLSLLPNAVITSRSSSETVRRHESSSSKPEMLPIGRSRGARGSISEMDIIHEMDD